MAIGPKGDGATIVVVKGLLKTHQDFFGGRIRLARIPLWKDRNVKPRTCVLRHDSQDTNNQRLAILVFSQQEQFRVDEPIAVLDPALRSSNLVQFDDPPTARGDVTAASWD